MKIVGPQTRILARLGVEDDTDHGLLADGLLPFSVPLPVEKCCALPSPKLIGFLATVFANNLYKYIYIYLYLFI